VAHDGVVVVMKQNDGGSRDCSEVGKGKKDGGKPRSLFSYFFFVSLLSSLFLFCLFPLNFLFLSFSVFSCFFFCFFHSFHPPPHQEVRGVFIRGKERET